MTNRIETEIMIAAPPERVWGSLVDLSGYAAWNPYLVCVEGVAEPGATITVHSRPVPGGHVMVQPVLVVAVEPPRAMRGEGGLPDREQFKGDHWWVLETVGTGATRLRHFEHFTGALAPAILGQHREVIRSNFIRFNEALKGHVESFTS
jgi:hypothetical protein